MAVTTLAQAIALLADNTVGDISEGDMRDITTFLAKFITESGGQDLSVGAIADGEILARSGTDVLGRTLAALGALLAASNLSDLANVATARSNLGSVQTLSEINALIAAAGHLLLTGGTMTGALTLFGAPTVDLHAATKKYVDDNVGGGGGISAKHATGRLYGSGAISGFVFATMTADRLIAVPWKLDPGITYDALFTRIHATGSGELRLAVYADLNGNPGAKLADSGDLGFTIGMVNGVVSFSPSTPDVWLALRATAALQIGRSATIYRHAINEIGTLDLTSGLLNQAVFRDGITAGALPDPFGTIDGFIATFTTQPVILARAGL